MEKLVAELQRQHPNLIFQPDDTFHWQPQTQTIRYAPLVSPEDTWSLLHEVGHARLDHKLYHWDMQLLAMEVAAWQEAVALGATCGITIANNHIEDCLDTYRDWVHKRSTCPTCSLQGIQSTSERYICINCNHTWVVSSERFHRPYRRSQ